MPLTRERRKELAMLGLYRDGRLSTGKAAELFGLTHRAFIALLARRGMDYFRQEAGEWAGEAAAVRQWLNERGPH